MEKNRKKLATQLFNEKYNCAQAIMVAYSDLVNINEETAFKIATGFGGGMARMGKTCGTINAAVMILSLMHGGTEKGDIESTEKTRKIVREFIKEFSAKHKGINCTDLLTEDEGSNHTMHSGKCESVVSEVCDLLDKYLQIEK